MPERLLMPGVLVRKHPDDVGPGGEAAAREKVGDEGEKVGDAPVLAVAPGEAAAHEDGPGGEAAAREKQTAQKDGDEGERVDVAGAHEDGPGGEAAAREKQTAQKDGGTHEDGLRNAAALEVNHIRQN